MPTSSTFPAKRDLRPHPIECSTAEGYQPSFKDCAACCHRASPLHTQIQVLQCLGQNRLSDFTLPGVWIPFGHNGVVTAPGGRHSWGSGGPLLHLDIVVPEEARQAHRIPKALQPHSQR